MVIDSSNDFAIKAEFLQGQDDYAIQMPLERSSCLLINLKSRV